MLVIPTDLWDREEARTALSVRDIQAVFRYFRRHTGASQTTVGALVSLSQPDVSDIERGRRLVQNVDVLRRIATGLKIPGALLGLGEATLPAADHAPSVPTRVPDVAQHAQEDDVRRRELLAGAIGTALITSAPTAASAAEAPASTLEDALFEPHDGRPVSLSRLSAALAVARTDFANAHYTRLGRELPALITAAEATRDAVTGHAREQAHVTLARAYVLATELAIKQHADIAWATADRALTAARASGAPLPISEAARVLAITMRRSGRPQAAVDLLARTAVTLGADERTSAPGTLAARTCLLLTAAYTAATGHDGTNALSLLDEAEETAQRLPAPSQQPPAAFSTIQAGPVACTLYRIGTYNALGSPHLGVRHAQRINPTRLPSAERRGRYWTDTARMWHHLGDHHRTYQALRAIEHEAPEEAQRPSVQALTTDLLYTSQHLPGLKEFASRTGALPN
jgi:transcriptional regulator with XRE-family HTH domain